MVVMVVMVMMVAMVVMVVSGKVVAKNNYVFCFVQTE